MPLLARCSDIVREVAVLGKFLAGHPVTVQVERSFAKIVRVISRPYVVAFIGSSGAGKSTLSRVLAEDVGLTGNFLYIGENSNKIEYKLKFVEWLKDQQKHPYLYLLLLVFMPFEMWIRYLAIRFKGENLLLVMDRYVYPKPGNSIFSRWYNFFTTVMLPKPDILFMLTGDLREIWDRKRKTSFVQFEKEYGKALRLFESGICLNRHQIGRAHV